VIPAQGFAQVAEHSADALLILTASPVAAVQLPDGLAEGPGQTRLGAGLPFRVPRKFAVPGHRPASAFRESVKPDLNDFSLSKTMPRD